MFYQTMLTDSQTTPTNLTNAYTLKTFHKHKLTQITMHRKETFDTKS